MTCGSLAREFPDGRHGSGAACFFPRDGMALNDASLFAAKVIFSQVRDTFGAEEAYRQIQVLALRYAPTSQGETSSVN